MATPRGRKSPNLIDRLVTEPGDFPFVQAIRLLERLALGHTSEKENNKLRAIGGHHHPKNECIHFNTETALLFPMGEISQLKKDPTDTELKIWHMTVTFMSLFGPSGVLPHHYSELILQRLKVSDHSMRDFFDMLNHRIISHFYRASIKYKMLPSFERSHLIGKTQFKDSKANGHNHTQSQVLLALAGLGDPSLQNRLGLSDDALISASGFLQQQVRSVKNLEQLIKFQFGIDATVEQFQGEWQNLQSDFRTKLSMDPSEGKNNILGQNAILGKKVWQAQGKFSVMLKPNSWDEFMEIAPDSSRLKAMENLIHLYVGIELDFDFTIQFSANEIPRTQLRQPKLNAPKSTDHAARLGWNCKLANSASKLSQNTKSDTLIRITRRAMHQTA